MSQKNVHPPSKRSLPFHTSDAPSLMYRAWLWKMQVEPKRWGLRLRNLDGGVHTWASELKVYKVIKSEPWSGHLATQQWALEKYWTNCSPSTYSPKRRHLIFMTERAVNSHPTTAVTQHWFLSIFKWKSKHASPQLLFPGPQNALPKIHQPMDTARKPH